jgi:hypothetical protein
MLYLNEVGDGMLDFKGVDRSLFLLKLSQNSLVWAGGDLITYSENNPLFK